MKELLVWSGGILVAVGLVILLVIATWADEAKWEQFKHDHHCVHVGHKDAQSFPTFGISSSGKSVVGVGTMPEQDAWQCDDGVTYWR